VIGHAVNPPDPASTSLGLLERVKAHDSAAWERVVVVYGPLVDLWCRQAGLQAADAADVRQDVMLAVARAVGEFRRDRPGDSFRGWLRAITRSKLADYWRKRPAATAVTGGSDAYRRLQQLAAADSEDSDAEAGLVYRRALDLIRTDFEERSWRAFWLVVMDGRSPVDVAAELGVSVNAVYLAKGRVLSRLREEFAGLIET
jgi:RNA polymerase sigma-70 factor (ECF subfamily)